MNPEAGRVDDKGQAHAGSQRQIQTYVNERKQEFNAIVLTHLKPPPERVVELRWVSPLAEKNFAEYQDAEFLERLDLSQHSTALREFWPSNGPCWDALAVLERVRPRGVVLVEAKSHVSEVESNCQAESPESRARIEASLACTKRRLGVDPNVDWMNDYYQSANRYAHLLFLRDLGVQAWLLNVYFVNDRTISEPASQTDWQVKLDEVKERLGLGGKSIPYTSELFLEVRNT